MDKTMTDLTLEQSFTIARYNQDIDRCQDVAKLQELLKEAVRLNIVQQATFAKLLKAEWNV